MYPRKPRLPKWLAALGLAFLATLAQGMSVLPPSFDELVDESSQISRGRVLSTEAFESVAANGKPIIKTRVVWQLDSTIKGSEDKTLELEFLGGTVAEKSLDVPGMPRFQVGDTDYLFVGKNRKALCPLIAGNHGRFPVVLQSATATESVTNADGTPLLDVSSIGKSELGHASCELRQGGMSTGDFETNLRNRILHSPSK